MKRTIKYFVLAFTIAATIHNSVFAAPTTAQIQSQKNELQADKNQLQNVQDKRFELEQNLEDLDNKIEDVMNEIDGNKKQMTKIQEDMKTTEQQLKQAEIDVKNERELFNDRLRAMYINGIDGYLNILLESNGFNDFLSKVEDIKSIIDMDKKLTEDIKTKEEQLSSKKMELSKQNDSLIALNNTNNSKMDQLKSDKGEQDKLIEDVKKQENLYASEVSSGQARLNEALKQVAAIRKAAPKYTLNRGAAATSSNSVIAYASNFLGTPYLWGGTTPSGFDCSGFTQYVYRHFGISLGRTTYNQIKNGYGVSKDQLQPGDLVFFGKGGNPTHMGIYIGNGMMIHAPHTGDVVKISPYERSDYITARRVM